MLPRALDPASYLFLIVSDEDNKAIAPESSGSSLLSFRFRFLLEAIRKLLQRDLYPPSSLFLIVSVHKQGNCLPLFLIDSY